MIALRPDPDDLAVGAVDRGAADGNPGQERPVERVSEENERPASTWSRTISTCRSTRPFPVGR